MGDVYIDVAQARLDRAERLGAHRSVIAPRADIRRAWIVGQRVGAVGGDRGVEGGQGRH
ncbi:hypothetical protein ACFVH4_21360 [Nocardia ignorata]|uniref:hypothetical protein n=1 Tax=Nocardia ignorata TaxID=145285 RepID=UPI003631D76F